MKARPFNVKRRQWQNTLIAALAALLFAPMAGASPDNPTALDRPHHRHERIARAAFRFGQELRELRRAVWRSSGRTELTERLGRMEQHAFELQAAAQSYAAFPILRERFEHLRRGMHHVREQIQSLLGLPHVGNRWREAQHAFHELREHIEM